MKLYFQNLLSSSQWQNNVVLTFDDNLIAAIEPFDKLPEGAELHHIGIPGFVDLQVNGGGDAMFNTSPTLSTLQQMATAHLKNGTCAMLPTLITDTFDKMQQASAAIIAARKAQITSIVGVHFEGPWLHKNKKGVHKEDYIRLPTKDEIELLCEPELGKVLITLAPEQVSPDTIKALCSRGISVFLGHSNASYEQASKALEAGACGFTHLFNAMSPLQSRSPGMVGAALAHKNSYAGLIIDGHHVSAASCRAAINAKGKEHIALVTDAMALAASDANSMPYFDETIAKTGNKLTLKDGTLAGSCLTMIDAVNNAVNLCDVSLADAVEMASLTPAKILGLDSILGSISIGKRANVLALNKSKRISGVWLNGRESN